MEKNELVEKIKKLTKEKEATILAHNYQIPQVQDIADYVGDSLQLSRIAQKIPCRIIVFCGVSFMAETAKILSPEKMVLLPRNEADCPMAAMVNPDSLREFRQMYPDAKVLSYVNTTAEVKAESDVCCTSANAIEVARNMDARKIIFLPDKNLASFVTKFVNENKQIIPYPGYCYVHERVQVENIIKAKKGHPDAEVIVHPECRPEVIEVADKVASTGGMIKYVKESPCKKFIIGTEEGIIHRLKKENPQKEFFTAGPALICRNMKFTTLKDVYLSLKEEKYQVMVRDDIRKRARVALDRMLEYSG
ncbi:quinolinate synthase NadA [Candidatus Aerophobetes bacterium]|nr:quinolinate synthase NadA [Candidatus Aerophobetes bacterium]